MKKFSGTVMNFYIFGDDGNRYGPVNVATINQWIGEGRVFPHTMVENAADGSRARAENIPGVVFPGQPGPGTAPPTAPGAPQYAQYPRGHFGVIEDPTPMFRKFNWGAFLLTWIWGLNHKQPITLVLLAIDIGSRAFSRNSSYGVFGLLLSLASLAIRIWIGTQGYRWAWESGRFNSVDDCKKCQAIWGWWGLGIVIASIGCIVLIAFFVVAAISR